MSSLAALVSDLAAGRVTVVDLSQPLGPDTPVIGLPPIFAASPGVTIDVISRYDDKGPAWYWNTIRMGEHTGTHFDAPVHWITGRDLPDNTTDTIPAGQFVGPACVIDVTAEVAANEDYLLDVAALERWEARTAAFRRARGYCCEPDGAGGGAAFLNVRDDGPHGPGSIRPRRCCSRRIATCWAWASKRSAPMPGRRDGSIRRSRITTSCTGTENSGWRACAISIDLPPTGAVVIAAPLKLVGGSGSPVRAIALVPA